MVSCTIAAARKQQRFQSLAAHAFVGSKIASILLDLEDTRVPRFMRPFFAITILLFFFGVLVGVSCGQGFAGWHITSAKRGDNIHAAMTKLLEDVLNVSRVAPEVVGEGGICIERTMGVEGNHGGWVGGLGGGKWYRGEKGVTQPIHSRDDHDSF